MSLIDQNLDRGLKLKLDSIVGRLNDMLNDRDWSIKPSDLLPSIMDAQLGKRFDGIDNDILSQLAYGKLADRQAKFQRSAYRYPTMSPSVATVQSQKTLDELRRRAAALGVRLTTTAERPNKLQPTYPLLPPLTTGRRGVPIQAYTPKEIQDSYNNVWWQLKDLNSGFSTLQLWDSRFDTIRSITDALNDKLKGKINADLLKKIRL